ncbi:MAG: hypothetical protein EU529_04355 [Promethearchaeota archaeon]|nr:MAG: hypothetical protein EU529_04355 [Candidatus Lokiarchaeota archaeon]
MKTITTNLEKEEELTIKKYIISKKNKESAKIFLKALAIFGIWMLLTYLLEGMLLTLQRPDATMNRMLYTFIANIVFGTIIGIYFIHYNLKSYDFSKEEYGFRSISFTLNSIIIGFLAGLGLYFAQNPPTYDPVIIANGFAQVLVVSIAEIIICWAIVGTISKHITKKKIGKILSVIFAVTISSILFGLYHFAHSPPFNTINMFIMLTIVGVVFTSIYYFIVKDIYGTIVFHNFLGVLGVLNALKQSGNLTAYTTPIVPLFITAGIALLILVLMDYFFIRRENY